MNAASIDFFEENANGSDTDTNSDEAPEYYQPISAGDNEDGDGNSDGDHALEFHQLPNGFCLHGAENGISSLDLNDGVEQNSSEDEDEDEEEEEEEEEAEEEMRREASEWAIRRAFREDENRRNAPLSAENSTRVMEAMRGVSFGGVAPDWTALVPEDRWIDQLRRLRQQPDT